jgi:hypothetical protein
MVKHKQTWSIVISYSSRYKYSTLQICEPNITLILAPLLLQMNTTQRESITEKTQIKRGKPL